MQKTIAKSVFTVLLLCLPLLGFSQVTLGGDWRSNTVDDQGNSITFKVSLKSDGTYTVDFAEDGKIDIEGKYTVDGNQMTIEDNACNEGKGVYKFVLTETTNTLTMVNDSCKRGGPTGKIVFTRIK